MTDPHMLGQLRLLRQRRHLEATRVAGPGSRARLAAQDDLAALDWALARLTPDPLAEAIAQVTEGHVVRDCVPSVGVAYRDEAGVVVVERFA